MSNASKQRKLQHLDGLHLPASKLCFCSDQLQNLNYIFARNLNSTEEPEYHKAVFLAKSVTERLIQRLICGVGLLDSRFTSKFLVTLPDYQPSDTSLCLEYLLRLDTLSQPTLYPSDQLPRYSVIENDEDSCPAGYAKIRLHASLAKYWYDLTNSSGYLRRDKVQAKVVELIAKAACEGIPDSPTLVDESVLCGSPGKVVDALTLHHILKRSPDEHLFYGPAGTNPNFPELKDFKIAIVDEPSGIRIRIGFLSPALSSLTVDVRILVAIGIDAWPSTTSFPFRIAFGHSDYVLYHKAAQTGFYLTGYGVHSSAWQIRLPAVEAQLENHYSQSSTIKQILRILNNIIQKIDAQFGQDRICYKILTYYSVRTALLHHLETDATSPSEVVVNWSQKYFSSHVLIVLDNLIYALKEQKQPNYFFPNANIFVNPGHLTDEDFILEAKKVETFLLRFFDQSLTSLKSNESFKYFLNAQKTELTLLYKWKEIIEGLMPPSSTKGRRICFVKIKQNSNVAYSQYTIRQLEYIGIALKHMLKVKELILQDVEEYSWVEKLKLLHFVQDSSIEDVVYILITLIGQAKDQFWKNLPETPAALKAKLKLKKQFDSSTSKLIELVRKENELENSETLDDISLVKIILKWLYKGLDQKKALALILRPYLNNLFLSSHALSWHLEVIKDQDIEDEVNALGKFSKLVNEDKVTPAQALIDAMNKNWGWSEKMFKVINLADLRLIFTPDRGKVLKHVLSLPKQDQDFQQNVNSLNETLQKKHSMAMRKKLICALFYNSIIINSNVTTNSINDCLPWYYYLKKTSPMTDLFQQLNRNGMHRCSGDIIQTLISMQKFNVLQDLSTHLPTEEQQKVSQAIMKLTSDKNSKRGTIKIKSDLFKISLDSDRYFVDENPSNIQEKYIPQEESAGIKDPILERQRKERERKEEYLLNSFSKNSYSKDNNTLIGSCRSVRIREDATIHEIQNCFRLQSLISKRK